MNTRHHAARRRQERRNIKRAALRPEHYDKYAQHTNPDDRYMAELLAQLVARFNGEEADHAA